MNGDKMCIRIGLLKKLNTHSPESVTVMYCQVMQSYTVLIKSNGDDPFQLHYKPT